MPPRRRVAVLKDLRTHRPKQRDERNKDVERKREARSEAARVEIPPVLDPQRRAKCLADPRLFLKTYFPSIFFSPFADHHLAMIAAIEERAKYGGDKAVAAPRGDGKTQVTIGMAIWALLATDRRFLVLIAKNGKKARSLFKQIKSKFDDPARYPLLAGDFPEISVPVAALAGAPQRASKQHVDGVLTRIEWSADRMRLPATPGSHYGGKRVIYFGMDSAIRGESEEGDRPDLAIIDDPETREAAFSETQHFEIEEMIDRDVAGLAGPTTKLARVVLTTVQNKRCYSYRVTNPKVKPQWDGVCYGMVKQWPERRDLWDEYIAIRQQGKASGDVHGREATAFYVAAMDEMKRGSQLTNPYRFVSAPGPDSQPLELDALQAFFNFVADYGLASAMSELQNEPEDDQEIATTTITPGIVQKRDSGLDRNTVPRVEGLKVFVGCDVGKYESYWVKIAIHGNAIAHIIDYGVAVTSQDIDEKSDRESVEQAVLRSLLAWRLEIMEEHPPEFAFVDSGTFTPAVYEFIRQANGVPFAAAKGHTSKQMRFEGSNRDDRLHYEQCRADFQGHEVGLWLYNFDSIYWKKQVHQRFITATFDDIGRYQDGTLSLWHEESKMAHKSFSHHICAEIWEEKFVEGKGLIGKWQPKSKRNHWLDATAMALAAAGVHGYRVLPRTLALPPAAQQNQSKQNQQSSRATTPDGRPYMVTDR